MNNYLTIGVVILLLVLIFAFSGCITQKRKKPIIYIYPTEATNVTIKLEFDGKITHTYD